MLMKEPQCVRFLSAPYQPVLVKKTTVVGDGVYPMVKVDGMYSNTTASGHTKALLPVCPRVKWIVKGNTGDTGGVVAEVSIIIRVLELGPLRATAITPTEALALMPLTVFKLILYPL